MNKQMTIGGKLYSVYSDDEYLAAMGDAFEPHMAALFGALVDPADVVADIGANIGLTALLFSQLARKVLAFEPGPSTFGILKDNLERAQAGNVEAFNLGLGREPGEMTITYAQENRSGAFVSERIRPGAGHRSERIRIETLDALFADADEAPGLLKIDVEGFEQSVLQGGARFLGARQPTVVLEMNHFCLNVLHRIPLPDFLDFVRTVFPHLYAVDTDNTSIVDMHDLDAAYVVMHRHVTENRFPNLVGGFHPGVKEKLDALRAAELERARQAAFETPKLVMPSGAVIAAEVPASLAAGEMVRVQVSVDNAGPEPWYGYGTHPVRLCYHWQAEDGSPLVFDGVRTELSPSMIAPRTRTQFEQNVWVPGQPGKYRLVLTLVQEGVCWLEEQGFTALVREVEVV